MDLKSDTKIGATYLTKLLDDLSAEGLVHRHRASCDRRQIAVGLTKEGLRVTRTVMASLELVVQPYQLKAMESLGLSLEQFALIADADRWFDG